VIAKFAVSFQILFTLDFITKLSAPPLPIPLTFCSYINIINLLHLNCVNSVYYRIILSHSSAIYINICLKDYYPVLIAIYLLLPVYTSCCRSRKYYMFHLNQALRYLKQGLQGQQYKSRLKLLQQLLNKKCLVSH